MLSDLPFHPPALRAAYAGARPRPTWSTRSSARLDAVGDPGIFIHLRDRDAADGRGRGAGPFDPEPLWGIPFAVKDNIDVAGRRPPPPAPPSPTRRRPRRLRRRAAARRRRADDRQDQSRPVRHRPRRACARPTRAPKNALDPEIVPGGSSSGSASRSAHGDRELFARHRHRRLGPRAGGAQQHRRAEADARRPLGHRRGAGLPDARHDLDLRADRRRRLCRLPRGAAATTRPTPIRRPCPAAAARPRRPALRIGVPDAASSSFFGDAVQEAAFARDARRARGGRGRDRAPRFQPFYAVAGCSMTAPGWPSATP
jgi:allophanate hydrolase